MDVIALGEIKTFAKDITKYSVMILLSIVVGMKLSKYLILSEGVPFRIIGTIIQVFAALLALIGMFAVYRMQIIQNEITLLDLSRNEKISQVHICDTELDNLKKFKKFIERHLEPYLDVLVEEENRISEQIDMDKGKKVAEYEFERGINPEWRDEYEIQNERTQGDVERVRTQKSELKIAVKKIETEITMKKEKILSIQERTKQSMIRVIIFLVCCIPLLPLDSMELRYSLPWYSSSVPFTFLVILVIIGSSILILLDIFHFIRESI